MDECRRRYRSKLGIKCNRRPRHIDMDDYEKDVVMEFSELIRKQIARDRRRGFKVDFDSDAAREEQLTKDLVGLFGEVGEFSNLLKKVMLTRSVPGYTGPTLESAGPELGEELADAAIYLIRLSTILGRNFEDDLIAKMKKNDERYGSLEK